MRVGIDGCKGGWCVVTSRPNKWEVSIFSDIREVSQTIPLELALIDIPIGLSSEFFFREVDNTARQYLGKGWSSSIFTPPCREAIVMEDYKKALSVNRTILGKGFSIQAWNICPKIREVDQFLLEENTVQNKLKEAHPEIVFRFLNNSISLQYKKKTSEGIRERLEILSKWKEDAIDIFENAISVIKRKEAAKDDIIDALGLAVAAELSSTYGLYTLADDQRDTKGLTINLHYTNPYVKKI